jgi:DNA-binding beta-propeller fold protein YncE
VTTVILKRIAFMIVLSALLSASAARADDVTYVPVSATYLDSKEGPLKSPEGVSCSSTGAIAVADTGNGRLLLYTFKDGSLSGGTEVRAPQVSYPVRLQFDAKGNLLVLDRKTNHIVRLDEKGAYVGVVDVKSGIGGEAVPCAFKIDSEGNLYVLDAASGAVLVQDPQGNSLRRLEAPKGVLFIDLAVDEAGTLYAVDSIAARVYSAPKDAKAFAPLTPSLKDRMSFPGYLAASRGRLTLVDQNGGGLVLLGIDGSFQGRQLSLGWNEGLVYYPAQICFPGSNYLLLADRGNNRVQVFSTGE